MKKLNSNVLLFLLLLLISLGIYVFQLIQFNSPGDTFFYFLQDMAFLPLQVAIVTLVLKKLLNSWEKKERLKKMNMVISAFFGEAGTDIIQKLLQFNMRVDDFLSYLEISNEWGNRDFQKAIKLFNGYEFCIDSKAQSLLALKEVLIKKQSFLLSMLGNPNLLEHDTFTDMLWAVFHLTDELVARDFLTDLPETDLNHLSNDMKRAFSTLIVEWINYVAHLKSNYPYLFSMAVRKNPFSNNSNVIIR